MGDLAQLLTAISLLVGALGTTTVGVLTALRSSPRERRRAATGVMRRLKESAKDGDLTDDEIRAALEEGEEDR